MIIDFHTHIFSQEVKEKRADLVNSDACFAELYSKPESRFCSADDLIRDMDEQGIQKSVVLNIGWCNHELCLQSNNYILESIARFPSRLIGFCAIQPAAEGKAVKEMERCAAAGARGIGEMRPDIQGYSLSDAALMSPVITAAEKLNLIFLIHASEPVGHQYQGKGRVTPDVLYPFIQSYPDLKLVLAHWGGGLPFYTLMPEVEKACGNVCFDTAASPFLYNPKVFSHIAAIAGATKILFGSDYPLLSPTRIIEQICASGLHEHEIASILGKNAEKLLRL